MAIRLAPLVVGSIELERARYLLYEYNELYEHRDIGKGYEWELKKGKKGKEKEQRKEVVKILTDPRFKEVRGYMHLDRMHRYKLLTRVRMCLNELKHQLNARKR